MELNTIYFYTVAIVDWIPLLENDKFKHIVLDSLIYLVKKNIPLLNRFTADDGTRDNQFWQKKGQSTFLFNREILEQKLDYTHYNPLQAHWNLVTDPNDYYFSSCSFYEQGDMKFDWLTHYMEAFGW